MTGERKRIVIVGATSAIAEHCARQWAENRNADFILVGRNGAKTERVAADLRVRDPQSDVRVIESDFIEAAAISRCVNDISTDLPVDIALIAHGSLPVQAKCQNDINACKKALEINGISPALFAESFAGAMQKADRGTLAIIGSVAGDRGRKSNYVYGAAKGLISRYVQGLQHRLADTGVRVVLIKPGPTDTPMTAHLKRNGARLAPVDQVARVIVKAIDRGKPVVYVPGKWMVIMMIIRHLPRFISDRLDL